MKFSLTSNVKEKFQTNRKTKNAVEFSETETGWLKREFGDAAFYTQLDMLSFILLVIVWCMIWFSCFKANYFWDRLSGSRPKVTIIISTALSLKRGRNFVVGFKRNRS